MSKKFRIYIDETGNSDLESSENPNHRFLTLTGVVFELSYVQDIVHPVIENLKSEYFNFHPDEPIVLHRKELVKKKPPFTILRNKETEQRFNQSLLQILRELDYIVISILIDKLEHKQRYSVWKFDPYHYCLSVMIKRYIMYLGQINSVGDVMIESRGKNEDSRLKKSFLYLWENGTNFITSNQIQKRLTSKQLKVKPKSANIAGLQIADLLAHPSRKEMIRELGQGKEDRYDFGNKIIDILQFKYYQSNNNIKGCGKKFLP